MAAPMWRAGPEDIQTKEDLGRALTFLRSESGLTVRELARHVGAPAATLGDYFAGRHLPGPRQMSLYLSLLRSCGVSDPALVELWVAALARVRASSDGRTAKGAAPFRGLEPFTEADAALFFGREAAVDELLGHLSRAQEGAPGSGTAAVVGPSGSGKSSLLMAGLLPAVAAGALDAGGEHWDTTVLTVERLGPSAMRRPHTEPGRRLVVIDQLEALFALDEPSRVAALRFLRLLQQSALVVYGLRADFYTTALAEPTLLAAFRHQLNLGPVTADELRDAIVGPVRYLGAGIEGGLVDVILAEFAPGGPPGHEPGSLPLLSYALLATWERAPHNFLTLADYRAVGGLRGAVQRAAESTFAELDGTEQSEARRIFARLVRVDEGPPTRRRVRREELLHERHPQGAATSTVLERFVRARLLTADTEHIQISHEALLGAWPRLADWITSDREWLRAHQRLADATRAWVDGGKDEDLLWRGGRLEAAMESASAPGRSEELNSLESAFLTTSSERERERELVRRRRARRTARLLAAVAVLAVVAIVLAMVAVNADLNAGRARDQALSRQVAIEAQQLQPTDPALAAQLAVAAYRISPTTQATSTMLDATAGEIPSRVFGPVGPTAVSASDANLFAVCQSATDTVRVFRISHHAPVPLAQVRAGPRSEPDYAVALSHNGRLLAAGGTTDTVALWNLRDPRRPVRLATLRGPKDTVYSLSFTPHGHELAAGDGAGTVYEWNVTDPAHPTPPKVLDAPGGAQVNALAYNSSGSLLAAAGNAGLFAVWKSTGASLSTAPGTATTAFESVSFGPGTALVVGSGNHDSIETWSLLPTGRLRRVLGPTTAATTEVNATAFSPDGSMIAVGAADGSIKLWNPQTLTPLAVFGDPYLVTSLAFAAHGQDLVSADSDGIVEVWPLPPPSTYTEPGSVYSLTYSTSGRYLAAGSAGADVGVTLWRDAQSLHPTRLVDVTMPKSFGPSDGAAAISPDGALLAVADFAARIQLFDVTHPRRPTPIGAPLRRNTPNIEQLFFSPNGKLLLAGDDSGRVLVWNVTDPSHPRPLATIRATGKIQGIAFSPGTRLLATASTDKLVRIYDFRDPARPKLLSTVGGFASYAYSTAFTPDGRTLVAGSADGTIRLWNIADPSHPRLLGRPLSVPSGYVFQLAVSPDGRTLAAASTSDGVWLWNIADPAHPSLVADLTAAQDAVFVVLFAPNDKVLAATGSDNTVHLFDYQPQAAAGAICSAAGAAITPKEWSQYIQGVPYRPPCR